MPVSFVHLRLHTEYSLVDGLVRVKPLIKAVADVGDRYRGHACRSNG
nr:hypothetical protein [Pseudomonas sp.]